MLNVCSKSVEAHFKRTNRTNISVFSQSALVSTIPVFLIQVIYHVLVRCMTYPSIFKMDTVDKTATPEASTVTGFFFLFNLRQCKLLAAVIDILCSYCFELRFLKAALLDFISCHLRTETFQ